MFVPKTWQSIAVYAHACHVLGQEAGKVAAQLEGLKKQLGSNKVDQIVEDYPRYATIEKYCIRLSDQG